ncbi:MAG: SUMF1/EgtB/PvdO family nonheme iron enzyme [bacterium]|nr:SUMF1/EgtB/PvdO family nonheme iron enzyme [bacterium]
MNGLSKEEREHLETKLEILMDNRQILDLRRAGFGNLHFPPYMETQLNEAEAEIRLISIKLGILPPFEVYQGNPIDWQQLHQAFNRQQLDKVSIKHIGAGLVGPQMLELDKVFFEQDVGSRTFEIEVLRQKNFKNHEKVKDLLRYADIWQAHIWRFAQGHRDFGRTQVDFDNHVLESFLQVLPQESLMIDFLQFQNVINEVAQSLNKMPQEILTGLQWLFETTIKREPVLTYLKTSGSTLLIGDAGVGKTTVLKMLTLEIFKQLRKGGKKTPIPIFVRLDKIANYLKEEQPLDEAREALLTYICSYWRPWLLNRDDLTISAIKSCSRPIQLMLDGLDEIPSNLRLKLAMTVQEMVKNPLFKVIITSRPVAVDEALVHAFGLPEVRLLELTAKQIKGFVHNFLKLYNNQNHEEVGQKDALTFLSALDDSKAAQEFATNSLYLTVMILMHKKHNVLPKKRIELYAEFYKMLLLQRSTVGDKPPFDVIVRNEKLFTWGEDTYTLLLQRIAFLTHSDEQDSVSISSKRVIEAIDQQGLQITGIGKEDLADRFLNFADESLGILFYRGVCYGFSHRSLQEYLTAIHLSEFSESQEIKDFWSEQVLKKPNHWLEVARLLFCEIRKKTFLREYLPNQWSQDIARTDNPRIIDMIGAILFDLEEFLKAGELQPLHQSVVMALTNRRDKSHHDPQLFLACGDALGLMDEPHIDVANPPMVHFNPEKPFDMGGNKGDEQPIHPVKLSPYWLGKYPVTNKEFGEFIKAGGYETKEYWFDEAGRFGFDGREFLMRLKEKAPAYWLNERFGKNRPLVPVVGVSWYEAMAYCRWWTLTYGEQWAEKQVKEHGAKKIKTPMLKAQCYCRLPTEAEWEFAACGFEGRKYPWGNTPQPSLERGNYFDSKLKQTATVGSYPKGSTPEEVLDLAGNDWEWCWEWYGKDYYERSPDENPAGPDNGNNRVLRSGSWDYGYHDDFRCANRNYFMPGSRYNNGGFRIARTFF